MLFPSQGIVTPDGPGDGLTNETAALQAAINIATESAVLDRNGKELAPRIVLDLGGRQWRFNEPITIEGVHRIQNGTLVSSVPPDTTAITVQPSAGESGVVCVWTDVTLKQLQWPRVVGVRLYRIGSSAFTRCRFHGFYGSDIDAQDAAVVLDGGVGVTFRDCWWRNNHVHLLFKRADGVRECSDVTLAASRFIDSRARAGVWGPLDGGERSVSALHVIGGAFEEAADGGYMIELEGTGNCSITGGVRFDNPGAGSIRSLAGLSDANRLRILDCRFSSTATAVHYTGAAPYVAPHVVATLTDLT